MIDYGYYYRIKGRYLCTPVTPLDPPVLYTSDYTQLPSVNQCYEATLLSMSYTILCTTLMTNTLIELTNNLSIFRRKYFYENIVFVDITYCI